eukprot:2466653-Alexandrium_andersonii.AAC.1
MQSRCFERVQAGLAWGALVDQLAKRGYLLPKDDPDTQAVALRLATRSQPAGLPPSLRASVVCQGLGAELDT